MRMLYKRERHFIRKCCNIKMILAIKVCLQGTRGAILTTHSMEEADALCSRVGIMVKGELRWVFINNEQIILFCWTINIAIESTTHSIPGSLAT